MDKENSKYMCTMEYYSVIKKNENLPLATMWIDLEGIMLSETNQRERQIFCNCLCVESKNKTNK